MQPSTKGRLFGLLCLIVSAGLFAYNWADLLNHNQFSLRLAAATPMLMFMSLAVIVFPSLLGAHISKDKKQIAALMTVLVIGCLLGGANFYMMDRYMGSAVAKPLDQIPPMPGQFNRPTIGNSQANRNAPASNRRP